MNTTLYVNYSSTKLGGDNEGYHYKNDPRAMFKNQK